MNTHPGGHGGWPGLALALQFKVANCQARHDID